MTNVEKYIADIGTMCNATLVEKKASNLHQWSRAIGAPGTNYGFDWAFMSNMH